MSTKTTPNHTFHIPVMGTGFSIDTPVKVAKYGISSVISLVDDTLIEEMRKFYCQQINEPYTAITKYEDDFRAKRITAYLNLLDRIVKQKFEEVRSSAFEIGSEITKHFEMLANNSPLRAMYTQMLREKDLALKTAMQDALRDQMRPGEIQVNIMTKLDRDNFAAKDKAPLPEEYSDALSALRGYAQSTLDSAIVFSAGINRRLYAYAEKFDDFFADATGEIKKQIILKVSDYRSAIIQGKFFAKKGLWISEYRIESGLNCGGHVFPTDGFLMGPILEEFKNKKAELIESLHAVHNEALKSKGRTALDVPPQVRITAQGGIGTAKENQFLLDHYKLDATGWATPFLLVPEVTNVDQATLDKLSKAKEEDLYVSGVSPLGVSFNNMRDTPSDMEKDRRAQAGKPGSACPKGHLVSNTEFTETPICTASRQYQHLKIEALKKLNMAAEAFKAKYEEVIQKACICHDLGEGAIIKHELTRKGTKNFTAVCPGPNIAYFSKIVSLKEMVSHIYGRINLLNDTYRPNMFIKELQMYIEHFSKEVRKVVSNPSDKQIHYLLEFRDNLLEGISYYRDLFPLMVDQSKEYCNIALEELEYSRQKLEFIIAQHKDIFQKTTANVR